MPAFRFGLRLPVETEPQPSSLGQARSESRSPLGKAPKIQVAGVLNTNQRLLCFDRWVPNKHASTDPPRLFREFSAVYVSGSRRPRGPRRFGEASGGGFSPRLRQEVRHLDFYLAHRMSGWNKSGICPSTYVYEINLYT